MIDNDNGEQPDEIDEYSYNLPDPARAAERVNEFLSWFGDGRIYLDDPHPPLFARDLQALTNLVDRATSECAIPEPTEGQNP